MEKLNEFNPLVSIIIPVYNGANYMKEAIDSALAQTYKNIEVLVINDGSKDGGVTERIALSYGSKIRYFHKENGGVATALNLAIQAMKGEYFSWLSHDDVYLPEKIESQIDYLRQSDNRDAVIYTDITYINEKSEITSIYHIPIFPKENFRLMFCMGGIINGCTLLVPKKCFDTCGLFDIKLRTTQDYDMWFRISEKFEFLHLPQAKILSRIHPNQDTIKLSQIAIKEQNELYCRFIKNLPIKEIRRMHDGNITLYYVFFAKKMKQLKFNTAYFCAIKLGFKSLFLHPPAEFKKVFIKLVDTLFPKLTTLYIELKYLVFNSNAK